MRALLLLTLLLSCGEGESREPWVGSRKVRDASGDVIAAVECDREGCVCLREQRMERRGPVYSEVEALTFCLEDVR